MINYFDNVISLMPLGQALTYSGIYSIESLESLPFSPLRNVIKALSFCILSYIEEL